MINYSYTLKDVNGDVRVVSKEGAPCFGSLQYSAGKLLELTYKVNVHTTRDVTKYWLGKFDYFFSSVKGTEFYQDSSVFMWSNPGNYPYRVILAVLTFIRYLDEKPNQVKLCMLLEQKGFSFEEAFVLLHYFTLRSHRDGSTAVYPFFSGVGHSLLSTIRAVSYKSIPAICKAIELASQEIPTFDQGDRENGVHKLFSQDVKYFTENIYCNHEYIESAILKELGIEKSIHL